MHSSLVPSLTILTLRCHRPQSSLKYAKCVVSCIARGSLTQLLHPLASFQVKNNGRFAVIITASPILPAPVKVPPGETSEPITVGAHYSIKSEVDHLPHPPPEILVDFSPKGHLNAKAVHSPTMLDVDVIANFDFAKGDSVLLLHLPRSPDHFFSLNVTS